MKKGKTFNNGSSSKRIEEEDSEDDRDLQIPKKKRGKSFHKKAKHVAFESKFASTRGSFKVKRVDSESTGHTLKSQFVLSSDVGVDTSATQALRPRKKKKKRPVPLEPDVKSPTSTKKFLAVKPVQKQYSLQLSGEIISNFKQYKGVQFSTALDKILNVQK